MGETEQFLETYVDSVVQSVLDVVDGESLEEDEYETFVELVKDKLENLPPFEELYK